MVGHRGSKNQNLMEKHEKYNLFCTNFGVIIPTIIFTIIL